MNSVSLSSSSSSSSSLPSSSSFASSLCVNCHYGRLAENKKMKEKEVVVVVFVAVCGDGSNHFPKKHWCSAASKYLS